MVDIFPELSGKVWLDLNVFFHQGLFQPLKKTRRWSLVITETKSILHCFYSRWCSPVYTWESPASSNGWCDPKAPPFTLEQLLWINRMIVNKQTDPPISVPPSEVQLLYLVRTTHPTRYLVIISWWRLWPTTNASLWAYWQGEVLG